MTIGYNSIFGESATDLAISVLGTANQITVTDNGDGTVTLSAPQDIHITATPRLEKLGLGDAADASSILYINDDAISSTSDLYGIYSDITKTAGITTVNNTLSGIFNSVTYNQSGGVEGWTSCFTNYFYHTDGDIGSDGTNRYLSVLDMYATLDGGKIYGDLYGNYVGIDQAAAHEITGDVYGFYSDIDLDGTVGGTSYGLYLNEATGVDYGIYQNGTATNVLGGDLIATGTIDAHEGKVLVEDNDTVAPDTQANGYVGVAVVDGTARLYFSSGGTMYYVDGTAVEIQAIEDGNPMPWLFWFTYQT